MLRKILGVIVGLVVGMCGMTVLHMLSMLIYPLPEGLDTSDYGAFGEYIATMPLGAFVLVWVAHGGGAFIAAATCTAIVGQRWWVGAWILGVLFTLAGISNLLMLAHPWWFAAVDALLYIPAALLGCYLVGSLFTGKNTHNDSSATKAM